MKKYNRESDVATQLLLQAHNDGSAKELYVNAYFPNKSLYFTPPSVSTCSVIRSRARVAPLASYKSVRSVRDLYRHYCDPNDPCCAKPDPEIPVITPSFAQTPDQLVKKAQECAPKNPMHFEYNILHRFKMKQMLRMAFERQMNSALTPEQLAEIMEAEREQMVSEREKAAQVTESKAYFERHPEQIISPPGPVVVDGAELEKALLGLTNMALAHEIALNKDFKLVVPDKSHEGISSKVEFEMNAKEEYWRKVEHVLDTKGGKQYKLIVVQVFSTLKSLLLSNLIPHNGFLREKIEQELDEKLLGRHIDRNSFDFHYYMEFIFDTLANLCCPVRDREILDLRHITNPAMQVRKTMDLMEKVNVDMANFIIGQSRNSIVKHCVAYERNKFAQYVDLQYRMGKDPIKVTRDWILRHCISLRPFQDTIALAFADILEWGDKEWPETLTLDWTRFSPHCHEVTRVTVIAAMTATVYDYSQTLLLEKEEDAKNFEKVQINKLKNQRLCGLIRDELQGLLTYEEISDPIKFKASLERCCVQVVKVVDEYKQKEHCTGLVDSEKEKLRNIVRSLNDLDHPLRLSYYCRAKEWFIELVKAGGAPPISSAPNLALIAHLIYPPITEMVRFAIYNRGVFDIVYREIYEGNCPRPKFTVDPENNELDESIANLFNKLDTCPAARSTVYRRSKIDERIKPMFDSYGNPIVDREYQPLHSKEKLTPEVQREVDRNLLLDEPTLEVDYAGTELDHMGDPDYMYSRNTEHLLKLLNRETIINENKLRRIKGRKEQERLERRVAGNLPVFPKAWHHDVADLQQEYCRLTRIVEKGPTLFPPGTRDEFPTTKHNFPPGCIYKQRSPKLSQVQYNEKGERIFYSRNRGRHFGNEPFKKPPSEFDFELLDRHEVDHNELSDSEMLDLKTSSPDG